jgi:HEAT repeat protein
LKLSSSLSFGVQSSVLEFELSSDVVVIPTAVTDKQTTLFVGLRNTKIVSKLPQSQAELQRIAEQVSSTGCLFTFSGGLVTEGRIAPDLSPLTAGIYREVAGRLQFVHALDDLAKYEVGEVDATGHYSAEYVRDAASTGRFHKRKLRYSDILAAKSSQVVLQAKVVPQVPTSDADITLAPDGRPTAIRSHEEIVIKGAQNPVESKTSVSLTGKNPVPGATHDWNAVASRLTRYAVDEAYGPKSAVAELDDARVHGRSYQQIVERLGVLAKDAPPGDAGKAVGSAAPAQHDVEETSVLFTALVATFRQKPETVALALQAIRSHSPASDRLIDALGSSGSAVAHAALDELVRKGSDPKVRTRALTALARTPEPSTQSVATLTGLLEKEPFSTQALYGLGTFARRFRDAGQAEQARSISTLLRERLRMAGNIAPRLLTVLTALMNCGCDDALPDVKPFLKDYREGVRAVAVRALQSMRDPAVEGLLATRLLTDPASEVQLAAIDSLRVRVPTDELVRAVSSVAASAPDPRVRYRAVELAVQWLPTRKDLGATLARIATNDPEPKVRSRAQAAL